MMKRTLIALLASVALLHIVGARVWAQTVTPTDETAVGIPATLLQTTIVRAAPETRAAIVGRLSSGDTVTVTARTDDARWLYVAAGALSGWLPSFALTLAGDPNDLPPTSAGLFATPPVAGTPAPVFVAAVGRVNIRREPRIGDNVIAQLNEGETAQATARSSQANDWLLIEVGDVSGWVAYFAVRVSGDPRTLRVLIPDSAPDGDALIPPSIQITTRFNTRMRELPSRDAPVLIVVPFGALITPLGRTADDAWVLARYDGREGWIDTALLEAPSEQIGALPIVEAD
ncbi:MAG: SH3 domain-containing protein [Chloroflexota bacterium]|nr:SH3 domain-containing protein [Chloroflexota bacterium]